MIGGQIIDIEMCINFDKFSFATKNLNILKQIQKVIEISIGPFLFIQILWAERFSIGGVRARAKTRHTEVPWQLSTSSIFTPLGWRGQWDPIGSD